MNERGQMLDFMLAITFSVFGMLLIFGLGFVLPEVNPYIVIKWIVIVCAAAFVYSVLAYLVRIFVMSKANKVSSKKVELPKVAAKKKGSKKK